MNTMTSRKAFEAMFRLPAFVKWSGFTYVSDFSGAIKDATIESLFTADQYQSKWEGFQAGRARARGEAEQDAKRLDWLEANPRVSEIHLNGETKNCQFFGVAGHQGVGLRTIIDMVIAAEQTKGEAT